MIFRIAFSILLIVLISGCSSSYKQLSNKNFSSQDPFIQTIINEYKKKADFEAIKMHDWNSAKLYSEKAIKSFNGIRIEPESIENWKISEKNNYELKKSYNNLMEIYEAAIKDDPINLAKAIVSLDCWAEQLEEGWQADHIQKCKSEFLEVMHLLYNNLIEKKDAAKMKTNSATIVSKKNNLINQIIYFDFDDFKLNSKNISELEKYIKEIKIDEYLVVGYTDTKGTKQYNYELSLRRANSIKQFLINLGINSDKIKILGKGENNLAIHTPDETAHPANRRAIIQPSY